MNKKNEIRRRKALFGTAEQEFLIGHLQKLNKTIMIVGDIGLDEYLIGDVRRISPEAPVPILEVTEEDQRLGLAANVAQNIVSLGGHTILISVMGDDRGSRMIQDLFKRFQIDGNHLVVDSTRPTTRKTRVMAKHHHLVRVDHEIRKYITSETESRILTQVANLISKVDGVIIQDYAKGVVTERVVKQVIELAHKNQKPVFVDPNRVNSASFYFGADIIKPNFDEGVDLSGLKFDDLRDSSNKVNEIGWAVQEKSGAQSVVLTRGKDGMTIFSGNKNNGEISEVPTFARKVFDVTGAGDTVIAALSLARCAGFDLVQSCMLANFAAGVVVGKVGCVPCELTELKEYIQSTKTY